ncbi:ATP-dependent DNA helicase RecG [subsurface metagenome]
MFLGEDRQEVRTLNGVGPVLERALARRGIKNLSDLISYFPKDYQDRRSVDPLSSALKKERINVKISITHKEWIGRGRARTLRVKISDPSGSAFLICFGRPYLAKALITGKNFWVSGKFYLRNGERVSSNFEIEEYQEEATNFGKIIPIYPLTENLTTAFLRRIIKQALALITKDLENELPTELSRRYNFPDKAEIIEWIHFPESFEQLRAAKESLIYEDFFFQQLILLKRSRKRRDSVKSRRSIDGELKKRLLQRLPFVLTRGQEKVLAEIEEDLFAPHTSARLLQGDVGCGKTLVAFLVSLSVIEAGEQVAFMAPTELLARQHAENAGNLVAPLGIRVAFISGSLSQKQRGALLESLNKGDIDLLIGTQALFSDDVQFKKLGLVIIDEQHRFGVRQRGAMLGKGGSTDLLLMTATPIPRSLTLTLFGDLELSEIKEKPGGRLPVITHLTRQGNEHQVYRRVLQEIEKGGQAYFVYPLIEESEKLQLKNAEEMYRHLKKRIFPGLRLALLHSRIAEDAKQHIMEDFAAGRIDILVATSVLEVGVDVPNAICMVIEHAERFGLATLHQLRGRVGRGSGQAYAFLIYSRRLTEEGIKRLKVIMSTDDGFQIAEEDLNIRGAGEFMGVKQSGFLKPGISDPVRDIEICRRARQDAMEIINDDPMVVLRKNSKLKRLLAGKADHIDLLLAGG